jgi:hypothetical protein
MAAELVIQREIKQSVINAGGYSTKLSNKFTIGIPDLGIWLAPFVPTIAEVKDLGICVPKFSRQVDVTPKQSDTMKRMQQSYRPEALLTVVLVHIRHRGLRRLVALPRTADRLTHEYEMANPWIERGSGGRWNIAALMQSYGIARL